MGGGAATVAWERAGRDEVPCDGVACLAGVIPGGVAGPRDRSEKLGTAGLVTTAALSGGVRRRSIEMSLSRRVGTAGGVGLPAAAAQDGHSPTGGRAAPHFKHLDNGSSR
jgi:hypothetical protein